MEMGNFVEAYANQVDAEKKNKCEQFLENCECGEDDDGGCAQNCFSDAGMDYCEDDNEANEVDITNFLECQELDFNDDNNNYNEQYYIGLKCSDDGQGIHLGMFTDQYCTIERNDDQYTDSSFPYKNKSFVTNDCISCVGIEDEDASGDEDYDEFGVSEMCWKNYEESAKCERNLDFYNVYTDGCSLIKEVSFRDGNRKMRFTTATIWVVWFLFLCSVGLTVTALYFFRESKRQIQLNGPQSEFISSRPRPKSRRVMKIFNRK